MSAVLPLQAERAPLDRPAAISVALWVFIAVVCALFGLFFAAYVMRLAGLEGYPLAMPWQFWLSTGLLAAGSGALEIARRTADAASARRWSLAGGALALAFVATQFGAWQALAGARVFVNGNPAASFLYVLTGLHAAHVIGGLVGWGYAWRAPSAQRWRIALCARYWHFLLLLWVVLFATLGLLTPEVVRAICGR